MSPYLDLQQIVTTAPASAWIDQIGRHIDLDNVIDYQLLLNVMQNFNGVPFRFWFHDALVYQPGSQPPFSHVLWDFDWGLNGQPWEWIENDLMRCLAADLPDYWNRCAARWRALRAGILSDGAVDRRLAERAVVLAPYIARDHRRWDYGNPGKVDADIAAGRAAARRNLHAIDQFLAVPRGNR